MRLHRPSSAERLLHLLRDGAHLTQQEAAEQLGVTPRQVRRLLNRLREQGVGIREVQRGKQKEYFLDGADLRTEGLPIGLTERQMLALVVAAEAARSALRPTPLAEPLAAALDELLRQIAPHVHTFEPEEELAHWHFSDAPSVQLDPEVFETLAEAIDEKQSVRIDYYTASHDRRSEGRKIDPLVMAAPGGSWICAAYCHERDAVRDFSLAGIEAIKLCDPDEESAYFDPPEDFSRDAYFRDRFQALAGGEVHVVRLLVEPDRAPYFERKQYHPTQVIEERSEDRADGRIVVSYEVAGLEEVAAWVRSWGPGVKVLDPPALAEQIVADAAATQARYEA